MIGMCDGTNVDGRPANVDVDGQIDGWPSQMIDMRT